MDGCLAGMKLPMLDSGWPHHVLPLRAVRHVLPPCAVDYVGSKNLKKKVCYFTLCVWKWPRTINKALCVVTMQRGYSFQNHTRILVCHDQS
jgi:hypothetical protein